MCLKLFRNKITLIMHTLLHSVQDIKWLGIHWITLRQAATKEIDYLKSQKSIKSLPQPVMLK